MRLVLFILTLTLISFTSAKTLQFGDATQPTKLAKVKPQYLHLLPLLAKKFEFGKINLVVY